VSSVVAPSSLRPFLIDAVERGIRRSRHQPVTTDDYARLAQPLPR
jgi:hypothetical protein